MTIGKYILAIFLSLVYFHGFAQEISIHPIPKIDSVWYSDVTEKSKPDPMSCEEGSIGYFRLKYTSEIIIDDFKKDTIKTKKEDWDKEDEEVFDEKYNKEKKTELEKLEDEFIEEDVDIATQAREEIDRYIDINWNGYAFNICKPDCESSVQQCYIYHEITQLKDTKKTYAYRTSFSWLEFNDDGDNEVEIDFDLVISYETLIYFFVVCNCDDIPDLISATPSRQLSDSNPWSHISLTGEKMKPFYSAVVSKKEGYPLLPVIGGIAGTGALIYILTENDDETPPCGAVTGFSILNEQCGDQNGSINITVEPPGNYLYSWNNGANTASISNLSAGVYTLTISLPDTDCSNTRQFEVLDLTIPVENPIISTINSDCGKNNGSATILNPKPFEFYMWSNGESGNSISELDPGQYTVTTTVGSCSGITKFSIPENEAEFIISSQVEQPSCSLADGSVSIDVTPVGNYTFQWSDGSSGAMNTLLSQGNYSVTVTEVETGCTKTSNFELIEKMAEIQLTFTSTEATCGKADGSITVDVTPPGDYIFQWSNGGSTASLTGLPAGEYSVTVTDSGTDCNITDSESIEEKPLEVEIEFILINPLCGMSDGAISIELTPAGIYSFEWSNGEVIQNIENLSSGTYGVTVTDQNGCTVSDQTLIEDFFPGLSAVDDNYEVAFGETLSENVLENDDGAELTVLQSFNENGGTVTIESNGDFVFIPEDDFSGEASFSYEIEDVCKQLDTGLVIIVIEPVECNFTALFETIAASCGLEDGVIMALVDPPGDYSFLWSDGSAESTLSQGAGGTYNLTITDNELGCDLLFDVILPEDEPDIVSGISVTQPFCSIPAEILFELTSSTSGPFLATIIHPNGIDAFVIPQGPVFLSDYLEILTGTYTLSIYDTNAGPECSQTFSVIIQEPTELTIALISIIPPSSPTADDGAVVIEVTAPGIPPYDIWVNEDVWDQTSESEFIVAGFGVGAYVIFITDAVGCTSNSIEFFIPPPLSSPLHFSVGILSSPSSTVEHINAFEYRPTLFFEASTTMKVIGLQTTTSMRFINQRNSHSIRLNQWVNIGKMKLGKIGFSFNGGLSLYLEDNHLNPPILMGEINGKVKLSRYTSAELFLNQTIESLPLTVGMRFNFAPPIPSIRYPGSFSLPH